MNCSIPDCDREALARGWCGLHYQRWRIHGDPLGLTWQDRFWQKVERTPGCWTWLGARGARGSLYGRFKIPGSTSPRPAHRVAYELEVGPIPEGLVLDHLCDNTLCVRPSHLEPVTNHENLTRYWTRRRAALVPD